MPNIAILVEIIVNCQDAQYALKLL